MKKFLAVISIAACGAVAVGQTNDYSNRNVRDPVQLQAKINADAAAVDSRLDALEGSTNVNGAGVFQSITAGGVTVQTNLTVSGRITAATVNALTVSTNATVGGTLGVTGAATAGSLAAPAATLGAATIQTNATVGGTLGVTGAATLTGGIVGGGSVTQYVYGVAAGTVDCITNVLITRQGIVISATP